MLWPACHAWTFACFPPPPVAVDRSGPAPGGELCRAGRRAPIPPARSGGGQARGLCLRRGRLRRLPYRSQEQRAPCWRGDRGLETPFGTFYGPNITPDPTYGIGSWTDADFIRALREGLRADGGASLSRLSLSFLHLDDRRRHARSQGLYLLPAAGCPAEPASTMSGFPSPGAGCRPSGAGSISPPAPSCRIRPRARSGTGAPISCRRWPIAGNAIRPGTSRAGWSTGSPFPAMRDGPDGLKVPNITPDKETGIGSWSH